MQSSDKNLAWKRHGYANLVLTLEPLSKSAVYLKAQRIEVMKLNEITPATTQAKLSSAI